MTELLSTFPGGLVTGAVYALLAMGLVLIYKATRIPNFAYGGMATFLAFFHYDIVNGRTYSFNFNALFLHLDAHPTVDLGFWAAVPVTLDGGRAARLRDREVRHPTLRSHVDRDAHRRHARPRPAAQLADPATLRRQRPHREQRERDLLPQPRVLDWRA